MVFHVQLRGTDSKYVWKLDFVLEFDVGRHIDTRSPHIHRLAYLHMHGLVYSIMICHSLAERTCLLRSSHLYVVGSYICVVS